MALAGADLASPSWYGEAGAPDWHYRVPLVLPPGSAPGSTVHVDVDMNALLGSLGIDAPSVDADEASIRVVRPDGTLVALQQFTDVVYAGVLDASNDGRGQARFILEDPPAAGAYYAYFDIIENGAKPPNPAQPVNGNFEHSAGSTPTGWVTSAVNAGGNQNNETYRTTPAATVNLAARCLDNGAVALDASPNGSGAATTGQAWHLLGYRDRCEDGGGSEQIRLSRDIPIAAGGGAGSLTFYFQVQSFDGISNANNYDWFRFFVNGALVDHTNLSIDNSTNPFLSIQASRLGRNGYGNTVLDFGWKRATLNLAPYAGTTINFRIEARFSGNDNSYRSWIKIDDVTWSRQDAALGTPEGFGANVQLPNDTASAPVSVHDVGDTLAIEVVADAAGLGATFSADVIDEDGVTVASGVALFDDGSHGDALAGDGVFTNDGLTASEPTYTFLASDPPGSNWLLRAFALDASISAVASDGLVHRPGQPVAPEQAASFFNVDEQVFRLAGAVLEAARALTTVRDPTLHSRPKAIPGAWVEYLLSITNRGPDAVDSDSVVLVDDVSADVAMCVTPACMCQICAAYPLPDPVPDDPVVFDDAGSPEPTGLGWNYATDVSYSSDGGSSFGYSPVPDAFGFDDAVTHVRINPGGSMNGPGAGGDPVFTIRFRVRVD